jgi:hypothetical protein
VRASKSFVASQLGGVDTLLTFVYKQRDSKTDQ